MGGGGGSRAPPDTRELGGRASTPRRGAAPLAGACPAAAPSGRRHRAAPPAPACRSLRYAAPNGRIARGSLRYGPEWADRRGRGAAEPVQYMLLHRRRPRGDPGRAGAPARPQRRVARRGAARTRGQGRAAPSTSAAAAGGRGREYGVARSALVQDQSPAGRARPPPSKHIGKGGMHPAAPWAGPRARCAAAIRSLHVQAPASLRRARGSKGRPGAKLPDRTCILTDSRRFGPNSRLSCEAPNGLHRGPRTGSACRFLNT